MRFYAEAEGADYFNVHIGGLNNGKILGPNTPGEWSKWYKLAPGHYTYTLAAEAKVDGRVIQCDHHNLEFTIDECKRDPKCPADASFDIQLYEQAELSGIIVDDCPDYYVVNYAVSTNLPRFDLTLPQGCTPMNDTFGSCKLEPNKTHEFSGVAYKGELKCGEDYETFRRDCKPCVACVDHPTPYQREDGSVFLPETSGPQYWLVDGLPAQSSVVVLEAECGETAGVVITLMDSSCSETVQCGVWKFSVEGECTCEDIELDPGCYEGNIDTVAHFKSYFSIPEDVGIVRIRRDGSSRFACRMSPIDADFVVVKGGPQFRLYTNVEKWDWLCTYCCGIGGIDGVSKPETISCKHPDISHISYFGCRD